MVSTALETEPDKLFEVVSFGPTSLFDDDGTTTMVVTQEMWSSPRAGGGAAHKESTSDGEEIRHNRQPGKPEA